MARDPEASPCWAVVPAAGVGARMGSVTPKQYLELRGQPIVLHALRRVLGHPRVTAAVVAISAEDGYWADCHARCAAAGVDPDRVSTAPGGAARSASVASALAVLATRADAADWVLVHDAARPCLRAEDLARLIAEVESSGAAGGLLAAPVRDTMKRAGGDGRVNRTVRRDDLWHALTPQMFRLGALRAALAGAAAAGVSVTDESSAMEWAGYGPLLVEGHPDNIKVTRPEDLEMAAAFLVAQGRG